MVDKGLHALLHGGTRRRNELVIVHLDRTGRHLVQTLVDDTKRLAEFLDTAEVTIIAIAVLAHGDVELNLKIRAESEGRLEIRDTLDVPRRTCRRAQLCGYPKEHRFHGA